VTFLSDHGKINTAILLLMASAWLYTEIIEHVKRDAFKTEIVEFIETIKHDQLLRRVRELEEVNKATECENGHD
jgi:thiaminase